MRFSCCADVSAMEKYPMVGAGQEFCRNEFHKFAFHLLRSVGFFRCKPESVAYAEYMCVDRHCSLVECDGKHHICSLPSDSGERDQSVEIMWHLTVKFRDKFSCKLHKMKRFRIRITYA